jgi:ribonuclease HI
MDEPLTLQFDGGSRGNPGPAGVGAVVLAADGTPLVTLGRFIGRATNNVAEYHALITALDEALKLGAKNVIVRGDSELIIKQMRGEYRVKHPDLIPLYEKARALLGRLKSVRFEHNLRGHNTLADKLANLAMDRKADVTDVDDHSPSPERASASRASEVKIGDHLECARCGGRVSIVKPGRAAHGATYTCSCGQPMRRTGR